MADEQLAGYFAEAAAWDVDRAAQTIQRARIAWAVAAAGWIGVVALSVSLACLTPLKTVEPYVIRVDNTTGIVDIVPMYPGGADLGEMVTRHLLSHYVTVCESFSYVTALRDYEECGAYHAIKRNQEWYSHWNSSNPNSPLNLYKDGTTIQAQVTAITFFRRPNGTTELAQIRYLKSTRAPGGSEVTLHWIATIEYAYGTPSRDPKVRRWNPLGFRITAFRTEAESVSPVTTTTAPTY